MTSLREEPSNLKYIDGTAMMIAEALITENELNPIKLAYKFSAAYAKDPLRGSLENNNHIKELADRLRSLHSKIHA